MPGAALDRASGRGILPPDDVPQELSAMGEEGFARLVRLAGAAGLPGVEQATSYGNPALKVGGRGFATSRQKWTPLLRFEARQNRELELSF